MQDKYAGDIGDYVKLGLLRHLTGHPMPDYKLGVAWYRVDLVEKNKGDGRKVEYLKKHEQYQRVDPDLFKHLDGVVFSGNRTIRSLESMLTGATFYRDCVPTQGPPAHRRESRENEWFEGAKKCLTGCNLVFADPDNGIIDDQVKRKGEKKFCKQIPLQEVRELVGGRCGIIYHHNSRYKGGHKMEIDHWLGQLGGSAVAIRARAYSSRTFFVINPNSEIIERVHEFCMKWKGIKVSMHEPA